MGLFKKKEESIAVEDTDVTASVDSGRRFSVIIEGITTMLDGNGDIVESHFIPAKRPYVEPKEFPLSLLIIAAAALLIVVTGTVIIVRRKNKK